MGAIGSHTIEQNEECVTRWNKANKYHFLHSIGLLFVSQVWICLFLCFFCGFFIFYYFCLCVFQNKKLHTYKPWNQTQSIHPNRQTLSKAGIAFTIGITLFSGSLYTLVRKHCNAHALKQNTDIRDKSAFCVFFFVFVFAHIRNFIFYFFNFFFFCAYFETKLTLFFFLHMTTKKTLSTKIKKKQSIETQNGFVIGLHTE